MSIWDIANCRIRIEKADNAGVFDVSDSNFVVDNTPPDTNITDTPPDPSSSTSATFIVSATESNCEFTLDINGNQILGSQAALATTATDGFTYIPTCAGTPTGTPTSYTGKVPMIYDTTNSIMYVYTGGAWTAV